MKEKRINKNKIGFSLAEVLIILGVIGIVTAITLPVLIKNYQKHITVSRLKKAYTELSQAIKFAEAEYGDIENWDWNELNSLNFFNKYFSHYMKIKQTTRKKEPIKYYSLNGDVSGLQVMNNSSYLVISNSGYELLFSNSIPDNNFNIYVDINGHQKPNTLGKDLFVFSLIKNKKGILPYSLDGNDSPITDRNRLKNGPAKYNTICRKSGTGAWCAALIMIDGWKISDDYPW